MSKTRSKESLQGRTARNVVRGLLAALVALAVSGLAAAQNENQDRAKREEAKLSLLPTPTTPAIITPPPGSFAFLAETRWARRAMFVFLSERALPGPSMALVPKPHYSPIAPERVRRSLPTF